MDVKYRLFDLFIHDLTPQLSVISTSTAGLLQKTAQFGPLTDKQRRIAERILRNAQNAQTLLREMIEILRSEEGLFQKDSFSIESSLKESILDALEMSDPEIVEDLYSVRDQADFRDRLKPHGISFQIAGRYGHAPFCHDERKVRQVLRNLISNGLKYRQEKIVLTVSGETDLVILIEDDGRGIPPEKQGTIFNRFVRLNDKNHPEVPGLGLGLSGVKTLVEAMGGEITVASQEGLGARFTVRIPPLH